MVREKKRSKVQGEIASVEVWFHGKVILIPQFLDEYFTESNLFMCTYVQFMLLY